MRRAKDSQKRQHASDGSSDEDKPKKKKSPVVNLQLSEDSSSDSDIETYLTSPSKLDLNSSFFNTVKTTEKDEKLVHENTDLDRLSDSESDSNDKSTQNEPKAEINELPTTSTTYNFEHISTFNQKFEEAKKLIEVYKAKKAKEVQNEDMDVDDILYNEEKALYSSLGSSEFETLSDGENKSDWEEVEDKEDESLVRKEGVQITIDLPGNVKKKKSLDLMAAIKRRINRKKKENQVLVHKVHLLCWIGHGFHVNSILSNQNLLGVALSLLPSKHCYPTNRVDLSYLENITGWYKKTIINKNTQMELNEPLEKVLQEQMLKKEALNYKMYIYIFICILRSLGVKCRLILSLQTEPLRPPQSELCSLSNKNKKEPENLGESSKKIGSTKKNTKRVTFNLNRTYKDKSFNTSLKHFEKKPLKRCASKDQTVDNKDGQVRRSLRKSSKSPTIQETKIEKESKSKNEKEVKKDDVKVEKTSRKNSGDDFKKAKSTKKSQQLKNESLNENNSKRNDSKTSSSDLKVRRSSRKSSKSPIFNPENEDNSKRNEELLADAKKMKSRRSKSPVRLENENKTISSDLKIRKSTRKISKSPVLQAENEGNSEIQQELSADDDSKKKKMARTSRSLKNPENETLAGGSDLKIRMSTRKNSTSPALQPENEDNSKINRELLADDESKKKKMAKRSKSPKNLENENLAGGSDLKIRKSTRKSSKSPALQPENEDNSKINQELSADAKKRKSRRSKSPVKLENENKTNSSDLKIRKSTRKISKSPVLQTENEDNSKINQELLVDDDSKKNKTTRRSKSATNLENENLLGGSDLKIRKSTRKMSKSPVLQPENEDISKINEELLGDDDSKKKKITRKSKSPANLENENLLGGSDLKVRRSTRKMSKSPVLKPKNEDDSKTNQELSSINPSEKKKSARRSKSPIKTGNDNLLSTDLKLRRSTRNTSKSPAVDDKNEENLNKRQAESETLRNPDEIIKNKTLKKRKSKSPAKPETLQDDSKDLLQNDSTEITSKKELLKIKLPIPTRLRNLDNVQVEENNEESEDDTNKIKFVPPVNIKEEVSNSPDTPKEDEEFHGFNTTQNTELVKKNFDSPSEDKEFLGFNSSQIINTKSSDEIEGFRGFSPQFLIKSSNSPNISNNNKDEPSFSGAQIPQLDGGADTPPKNKKKPNLAKLKMASGDKCPRVHLSRLKIPSKVSKQVDSEDEFKPSSSITKTSPLKRTRSVFSTSSPDSDKSRYFGGSPSKKSKQLDVRNDIVALVKGTLAQEKETNLHKLVKRKKTSSEEDSDFLPGKISSLNTTTKVKRRVPMKKDLVEIEKKKAEDKEKLKKSKEINVWVEVFAEAEEKWISVDVIKGQVHCVKEIYSRASHPVSYILGFDNDNHVKDITKRYCENWNTVTRKLRIDQSWWDQTLLPYKAPSNAREKEEDDDLARLQLDQPLPKTISEYKDHPLYVLERHLLKFQAIYPPNALTVGFVRNEPVYSRDCVYTLHSREIWLKDAKVVKPGEKPYKIVKARPKYDRLSNTIITDQMLEIFGIWQVEEYVPPTAENGIVPKNAYGNVDLFKPRMLPKGTVHLQFPGLNKVARKLNIDCAPAVTGFDFHSGFSHPVFDGFVVCEEFSEQVVAAWIYEQEEFEKKEKEKNEKRIYDNWKKLIKGLLIRERLNRRYAFGNPQSKEKNLKGSKKKQS
nr:DNA repair protein complementing XP-C cells homolog isoform X1 [Onthophagus taurus]XP_022911416.1 DNA repair protein complementing XP-C cells homolog isoform X1 [Onthophagus taurus]